MIIQSLFDCKSTKYLKIKNEKLRNIFSTFVQTHGCISKCRIFYLSLLQQKRSLTPCQKHQIVFSVAKVHKISPAVALLWITNYLRIGIIIVFLHQILINKSL